MTAVFGTVDEPSSKVKIKNGCTYAITHLPTQMKDTSGWVSEFIQMLTVVGFGGGGGGWKGKGKRGGGATAQTNHDHQTHPATQRQPMVNLRHRHRSQSLNQQATPCQPPKNCFLEPKSKLHFMTPSPQNVDLSMIFTNTATDISPHSLSHSGQ